MTNHKIDDGQSPASSGFSGRKLWQTALLLAGSAVFGGLAVAFWNRKELAEMRSRTSENQPQPESRDEDIY
jgi:hypothetical protein